MYRIEILKKRKNEWVPTAWAGKCADLAALKERCRNIVKGERTNAARLLGPHRRVLYRVFK